MLVSTSVSPSTLFQAEFEAEQEYLKTISLLSEEEQRKGGVWLDMKPPCLLSVHLFHAFFLSNCSLPALSSTVLLLLEG
jgi:hypothetical protein